MKRYNIALFTLIVCACSVQAQTVEPITYKQYMHKVSADNLEYAAEKMNVSVAHADVIAAKVFDDPSLSFTYSNNEDHTLQMGQSYELELSQNVTLGRRTAGIKLARSQNELAEIVLDDYFRNLQADATIAYLEVMKQKQLSDIKRSAWSNMYDLAKSDSIRLASGKIMEVEAIQSKLEADIMYNEVLQAETDLKQAYMQLSLFVGTTVTDTLFHPVEELKKPELTADWEMKLGNIAKGKMKQETFLKEIRNYTCDIVDEIKTGQGTFRHDNLTNKICPNCGKKLLAVNGKNAKMLVCQDRECGYKETLSRTTNARCPKCHKRMEMYVKGKEETFICACGYKEKLSAFQARRAKEGAGVNKRDVQKYMRQQQKEAKEPVNNAFAQALAGLKLE